MEENKEIFTYTYSARQQEEVRRILQKYTPPQEDKMELLRRLDSSPVPLPASRSAYAVR